jgi:RsiW-degrading membrane proteinase PrsW (M82 family)
MESPTPDQWKKFQDTTDKVVEKAKQQASSVVSDLKAISLREEVVPFDAANVRRLLRDYVFWIVAVLGIVPILIESIDHEGFRLFVFALFFAFLWGVTIKYFIVRVDHNWPILIISLLTTGFLGVASLILFLTLLPSFVLDLPNSRIPIVSFFGNVFCFGVIEEVWKSFPVIGYLLWKSERADPMVTLLVGVFSGLGFAAFENVQYGDLAIHLSAYETIQDGAAGFSRGIRSSMSMILTRSLSLVLLHAIWSGIVAYYLALASITRMRWIALYLMGILVAGILHGLYNWWLNILSTVSVTIAAASLMLFYAYVAKLRHLAADRTEQTVTLR